MSDRLDGGRRAGGGIRAQQVLGATCRSLGAHPARRLDPHRSQCSLMSASTEHVTGRGPATNGRPPTGSHRRAWAPRPGARHRAPPRRSSSCPTSPSGRSPQRSLGRTTPERSSFPGDRALARRCSTTDSRPTGRLGCAPSPTSGRRPSTPWRSCSNERSARLQCAPCAVSHSRVSPSAMVPPAIPSSAENGPHS